MPTASRTTSPSNATSRSSSRVKAEAQRLEKRSRSGGDRAGAKKKADDKAVRPTRSRSLSRAPVSGGNSVGSPRDKSLSPAGASWTDVRTPALTERSIASMQGDESPPPRVDIPSLSRSDVPLQQRDVPLPQNEVNAPKGDSRDVSSLDDKQDNQQIQLRVPSKDELADMLPEVHDRELAGLSDEALRDKLREIAALSVAHQNRSRDAELERERFAAELDALRRVQAQDRSAWESERERMVTDLEKIRDDTGGNADVVDRMANENTSLKKQLDFLSRDYTKLQELSTHVSAGAHQDMEKELAEMTTKAFEYQKIVEERDEQLIAAVEENEELENRAREAEELAKSVLEPVVQSERGNANGVKSEPSAPDYVPFPPDDPALSSIRAEILAAREESLRQRKLHESEMDFMRKSLEQSMAQVDVMVKLIKHNEGSPVSGVTPIRSVAGSREPSPMQFVQPAFGDSQSTVPVVKKDGRGFADDDDVRNLPKSENSQ